MNKLHVLAISLIAAACSTNTDVSGTAANAAPAADVPLKPSSGFVRKNIPAEDPGPPMYARVSTIMNELFVSTDGWLVIPFYRDPACVPAQFNLLRLFDFPGEAGPGAFGCPIHLTGELLIERDAPLGTFPKQAVLTGSAVPFWFVRYSDFTAAAEDGTVTIQELRDLPGRLAGVADQFHELLQPREADHKIQMEAGGRLEDGRQFTFSVTHQQADTKALHLQFR